MSALPYMPLYVADYMSDAAHLTTEEHGAYLLLIMTYWQRGKPLPASSDRLARIARMTNERWTDVERTLSEFFIIEGDTWRHKRIDAELAKVTDKSIKAKEAGKASGRARKPTDAQQTFNGRSADVEQTPNHTDTDTDTEAERADARAEGHREVADRILKATDFPLSSWEDGFLCTVAATSKLSTDQQSSFDAIASRWRNKQPNAPPPPTQVPVIEGSEAWAAWQRAKGKRLPTTDLKDERGNAIGKRGWYFPTEFPDQKGAAA